MAALKASSIKGSNRRDRRDNSQPNTLPAQISGLNFRLWREINTVKYVVATSPGFAPCTSGFAGANTTSLPPPAAAADLQPVAQAFQCGSSGTRGSGSCDRTECLPGSSVEKCSAERSPGGIVAAGIARPAAPAGLCVIGKLSNLKIWNLAPPKHHQSALPPAFPSRQMQTERQMLHSDSSFPSHAPGEISLRAS